MKIKGSITLLVNGDHTRIEVRDENACVTFLKIELSPEQLCMALSRLSNTKCDVEVYSLDKINKTHENDTYTFAIPKELYDSRNEERLDGIVKGILTDGWVADKYYRSQNSFFTKDGKYFARVTIRRWI